MVFCPCCCGGKSNRWRMKCFGITSVALVVFGAFLYSIYKAIYVSIIKEQSQLHEGTLLFPEWVEPTQVVDVGFFMMNITNGEEFASQSRDTFVKPILERKGPYVYRVTIKKDGLQPLDTSPKEIAFRQTFNFFYRPDLSVGSAEDDVITTMNFFALALPPILDHIFALPEAADIDASTKAAAYLAINAAIRRTDSNLLLKYPAGEILFGMRDPLYAELVGIINTLFGNTSLAEGILPLSDEFGFFQVLNNSIGWHDYQTYTGEPEYWLTNLITTLDGKTKLPYWFGESCNMINGSDGTVRPPFAPREDLVYHLYPSACRSTYVKYVRDTTIKRVPVWEFKPPPEMFKAPANSDYNRCFCKENDTSPYCIHDGGLYMGPCTFGAPLYISAPHFLHGDGHFLSLLEGMDPPDETIHSTEYSYEPSIGAAVSAKKKLQFNLYVTPNDKVSTSNLIGETFVFPIFWLNGTYVVSDKDADLLYGLIVVSEIVVICIQAALLAGGTLLLCSLVYYYTSRKQSSVDLYMEESEKHQQHENVKSSSRRKSSIHGHTNGSFVMKA